MTAQLIQRRVELARDNLLRQRRDGADMDSMGVIYTGNHHHTIPNNLLMDPVLSPADKLLWMVMRASISNPQAPGYVPSRDEICVAMNCSAPTISRARATLRIGRWMTYCMTVRDDLRRFVGDVYLLNEEPLSLADTLAMDPGYIGFLEEQCAGASNSKSNRSFAGHMLAQIESLPGDPRSPTQLEVIEQRIDVAMTLPSIFGNDSASMRPMGSQVKNFNVAFEQEIATDGAGISVSGGHEKNFNAAKGTHVKNFNLAQSQGRFLTPDKNFFSRGSSSSFINNNNKYISMRSREEHDENVEQGQLALDDLLNLPYSEALQRCHLGFLVAETIESRFKWLTEHWSSLSIVGRILLKLPENQRKAIGYQLFGRLIADNEDPEYRHRPIRNLVAYAQELVSRAQDDNFAMDRLGIMVKEAIEDKEPHFWVRAVGE